VLVCSFVRVLQRDRVFPTKKPVPESEDGKLGLERSPQLRQWVREGLLFLKKEKG
jgi:hypothetical protein